MRTDLYGQQIFTENDMCEIYMSNPDIKLTNVLTEEQITFLETLELEKIPNVITYQDPKLSVLNFDSQMQDNWHMPIEYKNMDIAKHILDLCKTDEELQRAGQELILFQQREMFDFLKYLKYLIDTIKKNNIVYGVGRGSSVASFVLFLLGVHRINSLYYDLSIDEFLK